MHNLTFPVGDRFQGNHQQERGMPKKQTSQIDVTTIFIMQLKPTEPRSTHTNFSYKKTPKSMEEIRIAPRLLE